MKEFMKTVWELTGKALIWGLGAIASAVLYTVYLIVAVVTNTIGLIGSLFALLADCIIDLTRNEELKKANRAFDNSIRRMFIYLANH